MKGGGGGWESSMKTKSWCSNCRKISPMMASAAPSSPSGSTSLLRRGNCLLKVAMSLTVLVLLFSIYQTCVQSRESSLPLWLSLSFVSRPSFLSSPELSEQPLEHPTSPLVEALAPAPRDLKLSSLFPADSGQETEPSEVHISDHKIGQSNTFEAQIGNSSRLERASDSGEDGLPVTDMGWSQDARHRPIQGKSTSESSFVEEELPMEKLGLVEDPQQVSNSSDLSSSSGEKEDFKEGKSVVLPETTSRKRSKTKSRGHHSSSSVEKDGVKESGTMIIIETASDENAKDGQTSEGTISEEELAVEVAMGNSAQETKSQKEAAVSKDHSAAGDHASAHAPAAPYGELAIPSNMTEKLMEERRLKLEEQLHAAKLAIEGATLADKDPSLYGVIFKNVSAFSKSYKLMEEMFKIYVYKEGKPPLVHTGPLLGIYASEGRFIERISKGSPFIVEDPASAHMFYLPYSVTQMTLTIYVEGSPSMQPLNDFIKDYVNQVAAKHPFWNRTRGADHFFLSCHDWGLATTRDHKELRKNAMKVVCNADPNEGFVMGRDVSLPEIYFYYTTKPLKVGGPGPARRPFLAFFAGQMHGHVRPILIEHWKDKDPDMRIYEVLPKEVEKKMNYIEHMKRSKYCICAAGFEVNSPRIVESIYFDCVPVIIADNFVLPFSDVLNWSTFSITIPESEIPNLKSILLSVSERQYKAMQKRLSIVRQHFLWHDEPIKYDVFHMIMHSVWKSRLNSLTP